MGWWHKLCHLSMAHGEADDDDKLEASWCLEIPCLKKHNNEDPPSRQMLCVLQDPAVGRLGQKEFLFRNI